MALVEGAGAQIPFPGLPASYDVLFTEASADNIARQSIWLSLHPEVSSRQAFNVADCGSKPTLTSERWIQLCRYFGLEGVAPLVSASLEYLGLFQLLILSKSSRRTPSLSHCRPSTSNCTRRCSTPIASKSQKFLGLISWIRFVVCLPLLWWFH